MTILTRLFPMIAKRPDVWAKATKRPVRFLKDKGLPKGQRTYRWLIGNGAGYIFGRTFFIAINCHQGPPANSRGILRLFKRGRNANGWAYWRFQVGLTQNANLVPYCEH